MQLSKPFDLAPLGKSLLVGLKSQAVPATQSILDWAGSSCALVDNAIVKGIGAVLIAVSPTIVAEVAKAVADAPVAVAAAAEAK